MSLCPVCSLALPPSTKDAEVHVNSHFEDTPKKDPINKKRPFDEYHTKNDEEFVECNFKNCYAMVRITQIEGHMNVHNDELIALEYSEQANSPLKKHTKVDIDFSQPSSSSSTTITTTTPTNNTHIPDDHFELPGPENTNIILKLRQILNSPFSNDSEILLCSDLDHYTSAFKDKGWGCGFRNIQTILSSMIREFPYSQVLFNAQKRVPTVKTLQYFLEEAWFHGFDPQGMRQLGHDIVDTKKWIGASDFATLCFFWSVNCTLVDFHCKCCSSGSTSGFYPFEKKGYGKNEGKSTGGKNGHKHSHPALFSWVYQYFYHRTDNTDENNSSAHPLPIYLQHQGHSRTIIGVEKSKSGELFLLILDPSESIASFFNDKATFRSLSLIRYPLSSLNHKQYQIVVLVREGSPKRDSKYDVHSSASRFGNSTLPSNKMESYKKLASVQIYSE
eukprot:TRINITY_DN3355_c0_g1_i1.p1 TRINITY_DN3355_c0_g1~~TRINITY_DN3355_c0_g1_i1.p1  ORF type:complete len:464 (-),score=87.68 TRINITY_DN3355_c0_g1_i1:290-1627(-)